MTVAEPEPRATLLSRGLGLSLLLHLATLTAIVLLAGRPHPVEQRRGEPLFVELPKVEEPAPRGNPAERAKEPAGPRRASPPPRAARAATPAPPAVARRSQPAAPPAVREMPAPPGPRVASEPAPEAPPVPSVKERPLPLPRPEPRLARPEAPVPAAPRETPAASLPRPEPRPARPESPAPKELPPPPVSPASPPAPRVAARPEAPPAPLPPKEAAPVASAPASPASPAPALPDSGKPSAPAESGPGGDRLAALRPHSRGGGLADGHGGIEGEPVPLDSKDPQFHDYFERVRQQIKDKWLYPREAAEKNIGGQLVLDFGIAKDGQLRFLELKRSSGVAVLDDYAMNAVKLASPFPPIPDAMNRVGIPVRGVFNYIIDLDRSSGWLNNFLR